MTTGDVAQVAFGRGFPLAILGEEGAVRVRIRILSVVVVVVALEIR